MPLLYASSDWNTTKKAKMVEKKNVELASDSIVPETSI